MTALYASAEIRAIEQAALRTLPAGTLMRRAGLAAAKLAMTLLPPAGTGSPVLVLAGPGNNGGDALEAAAMLCQAGQRVCVLLLADPERQSADAGRALAHARQSGAQCKEAVQAGQLLKQSWSLVIDGLFGIGLTRAIDGALHELIAQLNRTPYPVLALDVPSGLDADTGCVVGPNGIAVRASHTISFIADKPGLHTADGPDHVGLLAVETLDIDPLLFPAVRAQLNAVPLFAGALRRRLLNSHKGSYGDVIVAGGAPGMAGAPMLAARAAAAGGAGRVIVAFVGIAPAYDSRHPELMCRAAQTCEFADATLVVGPGLGKLRDSVDVLHRALDTPVSLVLDADALNLIGADPALQGKLAAHGRALLTPHPLEAARLLGTSSAAIQNDRMAAARALAQRYNAIVLLKGCGTVIAGPDGHLAINATGNPGLATAGSGDVLAGICGALLAQGWQAWEAGLAAVWLHGAAADELVRQGTGPIGIAAGELIPVVRSLLNRLVAEHLPQAKHLN